MMLAEATVMSEDVAADPIAMQETNDWDAAVEMVHLSDDPHDAPPPENDEPLSARKQMQDAYEQLSAVLLTILDNTDQQKLNAAISEGWSLGMRPARSLLFSGVVTADQLNAAIQIQRSAVQLSPNKIDWGVADCLPADFRERSLLLPYSVDDMGTIQIAHPHPKLSSEVENELQTFIGDAAWMLMWCSTAQIEACFEARKYQLIGLESDITADDSASASAMWKRLTDSPHADDTTVNALIAEILTNAALNNASDIHIAPTLNLVGGRYYTVRYRILGMLTDEHELAWKNGEKIINRFRVSSNVKEQPTLLADSRFTVDIPSTDEFYMRLSYVPTAYGPSIVIRLLPANASATQNLDTIWPTAYTGMSQNIRRLLRARPDGIVLVAGRTGDGKSTTLAAMLSEMCDGSRKVVSAENPVEYRVAGAEQVEVKEWVGTGAPPHGYPTWGNVLRSFLRSDPDVIMIGEIRDRETAEIAIRAAQTGHMVFSTIHVRDAAAAPSRLLDMAPGNEAALADTLNGVLAQRLLRRQCAACRTQTGHRANCATCQGTGWDGRVAVGELLTVDDAVRQAIAQPSAPASVIREVVGLESLARLLHRVLSKQVTNREEIQRIYGGDILELVDQQGGTDNG